MRTILSSPFFCSCRRFPLFWTTWQVKPILPISRLNCSQDFWGKMVLRSLGSSPFLLGLLWAYSRSPGRSDPPESGSAAHSSTSSPDPVWRGSEWQPAPQQNCDLGPSVPLAGRCRQCYSTGERRSSVPWWCAIKSERYAPVWAKGTIKRLETILAF